MDVSRSNKDFMSHGHNLPLSKVKLREGKDGSASNKIKKLKQRISASFGRLTLTKEETIPENDLEFEPSSLHGRGLLVDRMAFSYTSTPSSNACQSLNGTPDHKMKINQRNHQARLLQCLGHSLDDSSCKRKDEGYQSISLESNTSASTISHPGEVKGRKMLATPTNTSLFSCLPGSQSHNRLHQSSLKRAFSMLGSSSHHYHHQKQNIHGITTPNNSPGVLDSSMSAITIEFPNKPVNKIHQKHKHSAVQRHHSTGDMLGKVGSPEGINAPNTGNSKDVCLLSVDGGGKMTHLVDGEEGELARVRNGVRLRHHRPRSEGSFTGDGMRSKRASSFGSHSPFGKPHAYEKLEQLGEGSYATVYKGISLLTNKTVALKEIRLQPEEGTPFTAIREASLLKGLKHANIVTLHDIVHTKESLTFVFEFVHTDLGQYLEKHQGGINTKNVKLFMFQLLRGLLFCHERQILHRDLKPQNLLISEIGELKLADFGLARAKSVPSRTYSNEVVTLWYRPPDVLLGSTDYSTSLDIWGVGCIFTEMITGDATFPGMKDSFDQLDHIWQVFGTPSEGSWEGVTNLPNFDLEKFGTYPVRKLINSVPKLSSIPYAESLAEGLLQLQPNKRMDAYHALHHQYFYDIPNKLYQLPDAASIFNLPCIRLAPELDDLLRMRSSRGIPSTSSTLSNNQKSSLFHDVRASGKSFSDKMLPSIGGGKNSSKMSSKSLSCKASSNSKSFGPLSFKGPSAV